MLTLAFSTSRFSFPIVFRSFVMSTLPESQVSIAPSILSLEPRDRQVEPRLQGIISRLVAWFTRGWDSKNTYFLSLLYLLVK